MPNIISDSEKVSFKTRAEEDSAGRKVLVWEDFSEKVTFGQRRIGILGIPTSRGPGSWLPISTGEREEHGKSDRNDKKLRPLVGGRGAVHQEAGAEVSLGKTLPRKSTLVSSEGIHFVPISGQGCPHL